MKDGIDGNAIFRRLVENLERESPNHGTSEVIDCNRVAFRMTPDAKDARVDAAQELFS